MIFKQRKILSTVLASSMIVPQVSVVAFADTGDETAAQTDVTVNAGNFYVYKVYGETDCSISGELSLVGVSDGDNVEIAVTDTKNLSTEDVTNDGTADVAVELRGNDAAKYKLSSDTIQVKLVISPKKVAPSAVVTGTYSYTGKAISPTVEVTVDGNAIDAENYEVECSSKDVGEATATITAVDGKNYVFDPITVSFEIGKGNLTAAGTGKASGIYGNKLSELVIYGVIAKFDGSTVRGTWAITGTDTNIVPNVDDKTAYTVTFTPTRSDIYNSLTAEVTLDIKKAKLGDLEKKTVTYNKASTGEKTVKLDLPDIEGINFAEIAINDLGGIINGSPTCDDNGNVTFALSGTATDITKSAVVTLYFKSTNYDNFGIPLEIKLKEAEHQAAPKKCEMTCSINHDGTAYDVTIVGDRDMEYSFDGENFSSVSTIQNVAPDTAVTGYVRYAAVLDEEGFIEKNPSPAVSSTIIAKKAAAADPVITGDVNFKNSVEVAITTTDSDAKIFYTTDGTTPTESSKVYSSPITLTETTTIKAFAVSPNKDASKVVSKKFVKKPIGGTPTGGYTPSFPISDISTGNPTDPSIDGKEKSWEDIAKDIEKAAKGKTIRISLKDNKVVPAEVICAIAKSNVKVIFRIDHSFSWTIDGSEIDEKDAKEIDFTIRKITVNVTDDLRGIVGTTFTINGTDINSKLIINFKAIHAGKFANIFKKVNGRLVFVDTVKISKNGSAAGLDISEKGEYAAMLCEFSDRVGDMDNDGVINKNDVLSVLKDFAGLKKGENPLVADINGDGYRNAKDALLILKMIEGRL